MKNWKKWAMLLAISGPTATTCSCTSILAEALRDSFVDNASEWAGEAASEMLDRLFDSNGQRP